MRKVAAVEGRLVWFRSGSPRGHCFRTGGLAYDKQVLISGFKLGKCLIKMIYSKILIEYRILIGSKY